VSFSLVGRIRHGGDVALNHIPIHADQAGAGGFTECNPKLGVWTTGDNDFIKILDCFYEVALAQD
jgi:hypothetical protein